MEDLSSTKVAREYIRASFDVIMTDSPREDLENLMSKLLPLVKELPKTQLGPWVKLMSFTGAYNYGLKSQGDYAILSETHKQDLLKDEECISLYREIGLIN